MIFFVQVNNIAVTLPYLDDPILYVEQSASSILLNTNIGVKVSLKREI